MKIRSGFVSNSSSSSFVVTFKKDADTEFMKLWMDVYAQEDEYYKEERIEELQYTIEWKREQGQCTADEEVLIEKYRNMELLEISIDYNDENGYKFVKKMEDAGFIEIVEDLC